MAAPAPSKMFGSAPEPFDGKPTHAQAFWHALENYYYLNGDNFATEHKKVSSALTHFRIGTAAGEWARAVVRPASIPSCLYKAHMLLAAKTAQRVGYRADGGTALDAGGAASFRREVSMAGLRHYLEAVRSGDGSGFAGEEYDSGGSEWTRRSTGIR